MLLENITMLEFERGLKETLTVAVPFGSIEEHGPHLPLGTDTIHAYELLKYTSSQKPFFVAPPVWYGLCRSTKEHPGTVGIDSSILKYLTKAICKALYEKGLRNFLLLSGHAGGTHMASILDAADELLEELKDSKFAVLSIIDLVKMLPEGIVETEGDSHAGEVETSLMMYLRPESVKGSANREFPNFPKFIIARNKKKFWPGGVWGDPTLSSREKGKSILLEEAKILIKLIEKLEEFED